MTFSVARPAVVPGKIDLDRLHNLVERATGLLPERQAVEKTGKSWYSIENKADEGIAEVFVYDMIGDWGVTAADFIADLKALGSPSKITLRINSEGGEVFDGVAIYEALARSDAEIDGYVDGLAASAASFIAMAADRLTVARNARIMIHDASAFAWGNAKTMRDTAALLDDISDMIAGIYADRAGGKPADWRTKMQEETWFTAQKAVDEGLADAVGPAASERTQRQKSDSDEEPTDTAVVDPLAQFDFASVLTEAFR